METTTVNMENFPKDLWKRVGVQVAIEDINKKDIVIKVLEDYLNRINNQNPIIKHYLEKKQEEKEWKELLSDD